MSNSRPVVKLKKPVLRRGEPVRRLGVEIPVKLWLEARRTALEAGVPFRDLILSGLEKELRARKATKP